MSKHPPHTPPSHYRLTIAEYLAAKRGELSKQEVAVINKSREGQPPRPKKIYNNKSKVEKDGEVKLFQVSAEQDIHYSTNEIDNFDSN